MKYKEKNEEMTVTGNCCSFPKAIYTPLIRMEESHAGNH
jgi:hypothetical protein